MTLLAPAFLGALLLIPVLAAAYLLRVRARRRPVTALFLWDDVIVEHRSSRLFRRLRDVFSLLLMVAAIAALVFAAARPTPTGASRTDIIIVLDTSLSMQATYDGVAAIESARRRARDIVAGLGPDQRAVIATVDERGEVLCPLTDDRRRLRNAIDTAEASDRPSAPLGDTDLSRAAAISDDLRLIVLTDGVGPFDDFVTTDEREAAGEGNAEDNGGSTSVVSGDADAPDGSAAAAKVSPKVSPIELVRVVKSTSPDPTDAPTNLAIVAADLAAARGYDDHVLFFRLRSSAAEPVEAEVRLEQGDRVLRVIPLTVAPGTTPTEFVRVAVEPGAHRLVVSAAADDNNRRPPRPDVLRVDDTAWLIARSVPPVSVAVERADDGFASLAVRAFQDASGLLRLHDQADAGTPDLIIQRGTTDAVPGAPLALVFAPGSENDDARAADASDTSGRIDVVVPIVVDRDHPAFRFLDVENLDFPGARAVKAPANAAVLVRDASESDLVWQERRGDTLALVFNLDPIAGDFVLRPAFPLIVHGAASFLAGRDGTLPAAHRVGERALLPGAQPGAAASMLTSAAGTGNGAGTSSESPSAADDDIGARPAARIIRDAADRPALLPERAGLHRATASGLTTDVGASVFSDSESQLSPSIEASDTVAGLGAGRPWWTWLALLAVALLVGEELLYQRRKVG